MFFSLFPSFSESQPLVNVLNNISKNVKKWIHITKYQVIKRLDKLFFYGSDNFVVKPPMVMLQMMHCLQPKCTTIDFLLIFDNF